MQIYKIFVGKSSNATKLNFSDTFFNAPWLVSNMRWWHTGLGCGVVGCYVPLFCVNSAGVLTQLKRHRWTHKMGITNRIGSSGVFFFERWTKDSSMWYCCKICGAPRTQNRHEATSVCTTWQRSWSWCRGAHPPTATHSLSISLSLSFCWHKQEGL